MTPAERAREYRSRNREAINARGRARWAAKKRYQRRAAKLGKRKCAFCRILLASKYVRIKCKKYCDRCKADPEVRRYLRNLYQRRFHQKRAGGGVDSLTRAEDDE